MRIIALKIIKDFWVKHKDSEQFLKAWFYEAKKSSWKSPHDIKLKYPKASIASNNRVIFNIKGNRYRLIIAVKYEFQIIFIRFIGTHEEYDKIDAKKI